MNYDLLDAYALAFIQGNPIDEGVSLREHAERAFRLARVALKERDAAFQATKKEAA